MYCVNGLAIRSVFEQGELGEDEGIVQLRNENASSDLKLIIIKDSFVKLVCAYLSTIFQQIDLVVPRNLTGCTIAEYIERKKRIRIDDA